MVLKDYTYAITMNGNRYMIYQPLKSVGALSAPRYTKDDQRLLDITFYFLKLFRFF